MPPYPRKPITRKITTKDPTVSHSVPKNYPRKTKR